MSFRHGVWLNEWHKQVSAMNLDTFILYLRLMDISGKEGSYALPNELFDKENMMTIGPVNGTSLSLGEGPVQ